MYDAPPPYPGIDPALSAAYPPPQVNGHYPAAAAAGGEAPHAEGPQSAAAGLLSLMMMTMMAGFYNCLQVHCVICTFLQPFSLSSIVPYYSGSGC